MIRSLITLRELGENTSRMLVKQATGMPDTKSASDFMDGKVALLLFLRQSLPERLCITAAVRQMSGTTIYQGFNQEWRDELTECQQDLMQIFSYYMDCMYLYGFSLRQWNIKSENEFPVINAGSPEAHPIHALADISCMLKAAKDLQGIKTAWIGCANGTLYSLLTAMQWFPFSMKICIPSQFDSTSAKTIAEELRIQAEFVERPEDAVSGVDFIYAGWRGAIPEQELIYWEITPALLKHASDKVKLLLSASPVRAIYIDPAILESPISLLKKQSLYRLRVHKRVLHWILDK